MDTTKTDYSINDKIVSTLSNEIDFLALGDPTHFEGTITTHRIDLIKKLVKQGSFKVIAIESNLFELYAGHKKFVESGNPKDIYQALYGQFPCEELIELFDFVKAENEAGNSVSIIGFDSKFSGRRTFEDLHQYLEAYFSSRSILSTQEKETFYELLRKLIKHSRTDWNMDEEELVMIREISEKVLMTSSAQNPDEEIVMQTLSNISSECERLQLKGMDKHNKRDLNMADNILFLKEFYKDQKMVLWGSSTHFIKTPKAIYNNFFQKGRITFGQKMDELFSEKYSFIAYSAINGTKTFLLFDWKIRAPKKGSIEYLAMEKQTKRSRFLYFSDFSAFYKGKAHKKIKSRILGHSYTKMNIESVCDGIVFIENCQPYTPLE